MQTLGWRGTRLGRLVWSQRRASLTAQPAWLWGSSAGAAFALGFRCLVRMMTVCVLFPVAPGGESGCEWSVTVPGRPRSGNSQGSMVAEQTLNSCPDGVSHIKGGCSLRGHVSWRMNPPGPGVPLASPVVSAGFDLGQEGWLSDRSLLCVPGWSSLLSSACPQLICWIVDIRIESYTQTLPYCLLGNFINNIRQIK